MKKITINTVISTAVALSVVFMLQGYNIIITSVLAIMLGLIVFKELNDIK